MLADLPALGKQRCHECRESSDLATENAGEYLGLDPSGFLRLRTESGVAIVASGEVASW